jgi:hypothetical protein
MIPPVIREFLIASWQKFDDLCQNPSASKKQKLANVRSYEKEQRLARDFIRFEKNQKSSDAMQPTLIHNQLHAGANHPPKQYGAGQNIGIWTGVKFGCGMFVVLPLILFGIGFLVIMLPTCTAITTQRQKTEQKATSGNSREDEKIMAIADSNGDGTVTREEYFAAKETIQKESSQTKAGNETLAPE